MGTDTFTVTTAGMLGLVIAAQGILLSVVLLALPSGNRLANRCLAFFLAMEAVRMGTYFVYFSDFPSAAAFYYAPSISVLAGPALYLYVCALVEPKFEFGPTLRRVLWPVLPLPLLVMFVNLDTELSPGPFLGYSITGHVLYIHLLYDLVFIGYTVLAIAHLAGHRQRVETLFSSVHRVDLYWLRQVLLVSMLTWVMYLAVDLLRLAGWLDLSMRMQVNQLSSLLIIYLISIGGMRQPVIFTRAIRDLAIELDQADLVEPDLVHGANTVESQLNCDGYARAGIDGAEAAAVWTALEHHMLEQQPFLNNQLSLAELSEALVVSPQVLSLVINRQAGVTFYNYVNRFRVERAQELMKRSDRAQRNLLTIAIEAGFNSQSSFYSHFKKRVGMTPKEYRQQYCHQGAC